MSLSFGTVWIEIRDNLSLPDVQCVTVLRDGVD